MVAARRLKKSFLKGIGDIGVDVCEGLNLDLYTKKISYKNKVKEKYNDFSNEKITQDNFEYIERFKIKTIVKSFISSLLLFVIVLTKLFFYDNMMTNGILKRGYEHMEFDFSKELTLENFEDIFNKNYESIKNLVPQKIIEYIKYNYASKFKPYILKFSLLSFFNNEINNEVKIYNEVDIYNDNDMIKGNEKTIVEKENELNGIGGGEEYNNDKKVKPYKEMVKMDKDNLSDEEYFKSLNLDLVNPTKGVVTSPFGDREVIFQGVNPYHTGIDIANVANTDILSVCEGKVVNVINNNKYYGNYIEIQVNDIIFKYAHLNQINVNINDNVKKGDIIGLMGSTGYSTGPHLHFEVNVRGNKIDPELVMKFR